MTDLSKAEPTEGRDWSRSAHPERQCKAHKKTGERCKNASLAGQQVCGYHGGAAKHSKDAARRRLDAAADSLAKQLLGIASSAASESVRLAAIRDALDRTGVSAPKHVELTVTPADQLFSDLESMAGGSRAAWRRSTGHPDPEPESLAIESSTPGGPRVLGETFDGALVIDGEVASRDQGEPEHQGQADDPNDDDQGRRQTLTNYVETFPLPAGGYLPAESAMEAAQDANRMHRSRQGRG